ncbi:MAG: NADH-quinone oxidoreductase subunit C [Anaerolineae bacterium]
MTAGANAGRDVGRIEVSKEDYLGVAKRLKEKGFQRLLTVSAVDWIEEGTYEVYFVVHSLDENRYVEVTTYIRRDDPRIASLSGIWLNAPMHEREVWELFGIDFDGNAMLRPLFLEDWIGPPPFRKDCNWREYVKKNFTLSAPQEGDEHGPNRPDQSPESRS